MTDRRQAEDGQWYDPIWILPEDHPSQKKLPEGARDADLARAAGATPVDGSDHWRLPEPSDVGDEVVEAKQLRRRFATRAALERYRKAMADPEERATWRSRVARAANAEVRARGERPAREVPDVDTQMAQRTYFFTAREDGSEFSYKRLDGKAEEIGVPLQIDRDEGSPYRGLRFMVGDPPADLQPFRSEAAQAARAASEAGRLVVADAAETVGAPSSKRRNRPITAPRENTQAYDRARESLSGLGTGKLKALVEVTRQERDGILAQEKTLKAHGLELTDELKSQHGMLSRGLRLARGILQERGVEIDEPDDERGSGEGRDGQHDQMATTAVHGAAAGRRAARGQRGHGAEI